MHADSSGAASRSSFPIVMTLTYGFPYGETVQDCVKTGLRSSHYSADLLQRCMRHGVGYCVMAVLAKTQDMACDGWWLLRKNAWAGSSADSLLSGIRGKLTEFFRFFVPTSIHNHKERSRKIGLELRATARTYR